MDPTTGGLEALAGIAFSALQPPGSTMKIVTTVAALQAHLVTPGTGFPDATEATVGGYTLQNAGGEDCGGTLLNAFAVSCNSVFAPLGVKVGAKRFLRPRSGSGSTTRRRSRARSSRRSRPRAWTPTPSSAPRRSARVWCRRRH